MGLRFPVIPPTQDDLPQFTQPYLTIIIYPCQYLLLSSEYAIIIYSYKSLK